MPRAGSNLDTLTALRFVAALMVFFTHVAVVPRLINPGASGVSFFYVLSGFVLAWSYRPSTVSPRQFWRRRAARIVPAYLVAWAVGVAINFAQIGGHAFIDAIPGTVFMQAWFPQHDVHFAGNSVGWSLSCEALFYLLFPVIMSILGKRRDVMVGSLLLGCVAAAITIPVLVQSPDLNNYWTYLFPPTRLPEFVAGVCAGLLTTRGYRLPVPLPLALLLAAGAYTAAAFGPVWTSTVAFTVAPYVLVIMAAAARDLQGERVTALPYRALVRLGVWSYCFYLVHQLVVKLALHVGALTADGTLFAVACLAGAVTAAWLLFALVEHPANERLRGTRAEPAIYEPLVERS